MGGYQCKLLPLFLFFIFRNLQKAFSTVSLKSINLNSIIYNKLGRTRKCIQTINLNDGILNGCIYFLMTISKNNLIDKKLRLN